jgi:uncharacterized delta-60 repeat protein
MSKACLLAIALLAFPAWSHAADGDPDLTFGGGILHPPATTDPDDPALVAFRQDGRILLCSIESPTRHIFLSRFEASGQIDDTFGDEGVVDTGISMGLGLPVRMAIKSDSLIIVAGHRDGAQKLSVLQFDASGALDTGFGVQGVVLVNVNTGVETGFDIAITGRNNILLAGVDISRHEAFVVRITAAGAVDTAFGSGGIAYAGVPGDLGTNVAVDTDTNGVLLASVDLSSGHPYAARFDWTGQLVPGFGEEGIAVVDVTCGTDAPVDAKVGLSSNAYLAGYDGAQSEMFVACLEADGALEADFGGSGIVRTGVAAGSSSSLALVTCADGKPVIAGKDAMEPHFYACRFDTLGVPDADFGAGGVARLGMYADDAARVSLERCPDDGILLAGQDAGVQRAFAARFTADGELHRTGLLAGAAQTDLDQPHESKVAVVILPGGDHLLAGITGEAYYYVQRFDPTGVRNPNFWLGGNRVLYDILTIPDAPVDIALVPGTSEFYLLGYDESVDRLFVRRFQGDGSASSAFGSGLPVYIDINVDWFGDASLAILPDGRVRLAGVRETFRSHFMAGLLTDGQLDPGFGTAGFVFTGVHGGIWSGVELAATSTGDLFLAGMDVDSSKAFVMRFNSGGLPAAAFGTGGIARSGVSSTGGTVVDVGLALTSTGPVLAAYRGQYPLSGESYVARFTWAGTLDPGYGAGGVAFIGMETLDDLPVAIAAQRDGKIVLAGADAAGQRTYLARLGPTGALDPDFGSAGIVEADYRAGTGTGLDLAIQTNGRIQLAGRDLDRGQDFLARWMSTPGNVTAVQELGPPARPALLWNHPNPFRTGTTLRFDLPSRGTVRVEIYDIQGRLIRRLVEENLPSGSYSRAWDGKDDRGRTVGSGAYVARFQAGETVRYRRVLLVR